MFSLYGSFSAGTRYSLFVKAIDHVVDAQGALFCAGPWCGLADVCEREERVRGDVVLLFGWQSERLQNLFRFVKSRHSPSPPSLR